jgi:hypothetical protein
MGPTFHKKRRQEDDHARPKKKVKKVKKQTNYHSSSEDDDEDLVQPRASDAPKPLKRQPQNATDPGSKRVKSAKSEVQTTAPSKLVEQKSSAPRPILKDTTTSSTPIAKLTDGSRNDDEDEREEEADEDDESVEDEEQILEVNTVLNSIQTNDSDDDDDDNGEQLADLDLDDEPDLDSDISGDSDDSDSDTQSRTSGTSSNAIRVRKKRNDPNAFATSISKILDTKLSTSKRSDPVLSRSKSAAEANKTLADDKLEQKARAQIRAEKKLSSEKGRVRDTLGLRTPDVETGAIVELEKRLKKTAQRGVVKLFNAVRAAQVKSEEAMRAAKSEGVIGIQQREERASEMSKQGFLDLISAGGKKASVAA